MKRIFTITTILVLLYSCKTNENNIFTDQIVGVWKISKEINEGEESSLSGCLQEESIEIFYDRTLIGIKYKENSSNNCSIVSEIINGIWKKNTSNNYLIKTFKDFSITIDENTLRIWRKNDNPDDFYKEFIKI